MFEKIIIQSQKTADAENPLDLGFLAEAMLFYGTVEIVAGRAAIGQLIREIGPKLLLEFLDRGHLKVKFERNFTGIYTEAAAGLQLHTPTVAQIGGQDLIDVLRPLTIASTGREGRGRRLALRLTAKIETSLIAEEVARRVSSDLQNPSYVLECVKTILRFFVPRNQIPADARFEVITIGDAKFRVETNLDFAALNRAYRKHVSIEHSSLSEAYLLGHIFLTRKMVEDGGRNDAEFAVSPLHKDLVSLKVASLFRQREKSEAEIEVFEKIALRNGRTLSEVLACKERSFSDLLPLLEKASKFRGWLQDQPATSALLEAYFEAVTRDSWLDKLPTKATRFIIFAAAGHLVDELGAGGIGKVSALAVSAADSFLIESLLRGWRPNQFVNGPLREFVEPSTSISGE